MNASATMLAATQSRLGGPEVLSIDTVQRPTPRPNEILVRVRAAGLNPTDWKHRATGGFLGKPPFVLGWDVSGEVVETGIGVAAFKPGDQVFGMLPYPFGHGSLAEFVAAPARVFARKPESLDHVQAGALPLVFLTAWQGLVDYAHVGAGQRVLVLAAAGGVGHVAVQIAKSRGAYVIGTASEPKHEFLRELGVDEPLDYRSQPVSQAVGNVDVVLDTQGGEAALDALRTLKPGGVMVSTIPFADPALTALAEQLGVTVVPYLVDSSREDLARLTALVEAGDLTVHVEEVFPLARIADAHRLGETGRVSGKLVVSVA